MKNKFLQSLFVLALCLGMILSCTSCAITAYACDIMEDELVDIVSEKDTSKVHTIQIGHSTYDTQYISSKQSSLTNEIFNIYGIKEESSELVRSRIRINSQSGAVVGFSNINPYPQIEKIDDIADEKIKEIVEAMMSDLVDFSQYNEFELKRPHSSNSTYYLVWQVKQELLCNNKVEIYISSDGFIKNFDKTDACPTDLTKSFVTTNTRDNLLEDKICEYLGVETIDGIQYEIQSETLSYYNGSNAIIYVVKVADDDGFSQLIPLVIY